MQRPVLAFMDFAVAQRLERAPLLGDVCQIIGVKQRGGEVIAQREQLVRGVAEYLLAPRVDVLWTKPLALNYSPRSEAAPVAQA